MHCLNLELFLSNAVYTRVREMGAEFIAKLYSMWFFIRINKLDKFYLNTVDFGLVI